jgi:hypothetical protein
MMDIAIVTSCHNYGQYLHEWATSIIALGRKPKQVVIVNNGSTDDTERQMLEAADLLSRAGLEVIAYSIDRVDFGTARNVAVSLSDTEWVMHFDADDMIMPFALDDAAELADEADVIAFGYERCGDLEAGPKNITKVYADSQGESTLRSTAPASGVSPFRRGLWEQSPYRTDMEGGWDTALWLGFAHLGARFKATRRPVFWYRQHADSIFNVRRNSGWPRARVGAKLQSLRRGDAGVSILVPFQAAGAHRDRAWEWLQERLLGLYPEWEVVVGHCPTETRWRKGEAIADALSRATGSILVVMDADVILPAQALLQAVEKIEEGTPWVVPHSQVYRQDEGSSQDILDADPLSYFHPSVERLARAPYIGFAGGGAFVIERCAYEAVRGIPHIFTGWGAEDEAIAAILDTLVGPHERLDFDMIHLWHEPNDRDNYLANRQIYARIASVRGDVDRMWEVVSLASDTSVREFAHLTAGMVEASRVRTLEIRNMQQKRNQQANEDRKLALAAARLKTPY